MRDTISAAVEAVWPKGHRIEFSRDGIFVSLTDHPHNLAFAISAVDADRAPQFARDWLAQHCAA